MSMPEKEPEEQKRPYDIITPYWNMRKTYETEPNFGTQGQAVKLQR